MNKPANSTDTLQLQAHSRRVKRKGEVYPATSNESPEEE